MIETQYSPEKEAQLILYKRYALTLLLIMGGLYVGLHFVPHKGPLLSLLLSASEAGIVGGLADWFAVTALFRHPLGIPIPHTALIPNNKDRIGASMGTFIEEHFLDPTEVVARLKKINVAGRFGSWLSEERNAELISHYFLAASPHIVNSLNDDEIRTMITRVGKGELSELKLAPLLGDALELIIRHDQHRVLFEKAVVLIRQALIDNRYRILEVVESKSYWWVPASVDKKLAESIIESALEFVGDLEDENSDAREQFDQTLKELIEKFRTSEDFAVRVEDFKTKLIADDNVNLLLGQMWDHLRDHIISQTSNPSEALKDTIAEGVMGFGRKMRADPQMEVRINDRFEAMVLEVAVPWRRQIGKLIAEIVRGWDSDTITKRVELEIGRDLQFVRINGTIVGSLVGATVHLINVYLLPH